jgi:hypothetical protein
MALVESMLIYGYRHFDPDTGIHSIRAFGFQIPDQSGSYGTRLKFLMPCPAHFLGELSTLITSSERIYEESVLCVTNSSLSWSGMTCGTLLLLIEQPWPIRELIKVDSLMWV